MSELFEPIAIVGIAARLPGARDVREYWRLLAEGGEAITPLTDAELLAAGVPRRLIDDPAYVKMAGLIPGADMFDAAFFGMTPREAEVCDPQLRLFLEVTYEGDRGRRVTTPPGWAGTWAGTGACGPTRYYDLNVLAKPEKYGVRTGHRAELPGHGRQREGLRGHPVAAQARPHGAEDGVLTACSSSLVAVAGLPAAAAGECDRPSPEREGDVPAGGGLPGEPAMLLPPTGTAVRSTPGHRDHVHRRRGSGGAQAAVRRAGRRRPHPGGDPRRGGQQRRRGKASFTAPSVTGRPRDRTRWPGPRSTPADIDLRGDARTARRWATPSSWPPWPRRIASWRTSRCRRAASRWAR